MGDRLWGAATPKRTLVIQNHEVAENLCRALFMISVRSSLDSGTPNVRLNTECVRWISCLPYVGHLCEKVPAGRVCDLIHSWHSTILRGETLTESGHNQISQSAPLRQTRNFEHICVRRTTGFHYRSNART